MLSGSGARAVGGDQRRQTMHHSGVIGNDDRVARFRKTFLRKVEGGHQRRSVVCHQILGVILHDRLGVRLHGDAGLLQRFPQLPKLVLTALGARGDQRLDFDAAPYGARELVEDFAIVAPEERQGDRLPGVANHFDDRRFAILDGRHDPVGGPHHVS